MNLYSVYEITYERLIFLQKISSTIELKDNANEFLNVKFMSQCLNERTFKQTKKCDEIKVGDEIIFEVELTATSCLATQSLKIYPVGIDESLIIDIDMICSCSCEDPISDLYQMNSTRCSNKGTHKCGICDCDEGFTGRECECSSKSNLTTTEGNQCFSPTNPETECNGRGNCECGICKCFKLKNPEEVISGKYCECDNFSCQRNDGRVCSGSEHGTCKCGECICNVGWNGTDCSCSTLTETCTAPGDSNVCSEHGECVCGVCNCEKDDANRRYGKFCEKCSTCTGRCSYFKECVQCLVYQTGPLNTEACEASCSKTLHITKVTNINETSSNEDEQVCTFYDENQCLFRFIYNDRDESNVIIKAQKSLYCTAEERTFTIIVSIVSSIILVGLATILLWKLITTIQYRREYTRFEQERLNACWNSVRTFVYGHNFYK